MPMPPIETAPHWEIPSATAIQIAAPHPRIIALVKEHHQGLREISIEATEVHVTAGDSAETESHGTIQRLFLSTAAGETPAVDHETLARMAWIVAAGYVRKQQAKVVFRVWFTGVVDGVDFRKQTRITFRLEKAEEFFAKSKAEEQEIEDDDADSEPLTESTDPSSDLPAVATTTELVTNPDAHTMPFNPSVIISVQEQTLRLAKGAYEGPMQENRSLVREMRGEMSNMVRDIKSTFDTTNSAQLTMMREVCTFAMNQTRQANERVGKLETRMDEMGKQSNRQYENLQQLAQQGWVAMIDAMRMRKEDIADRDEWSRGIAEERLRAVPTAVEPAGSGLAQVFAQGAPIALAGLSLVIRSKHPEAADTFDFMARSMAGGQQQGEEEDEDEDEDVIPTTAQDASNGDGTYVGHPSGPAEAPPTPIADRIRALRMDVGEEGIRGMKDVLPSAAWKAFELACRASDDRTASRAVIRMSSLIESNPAVMLQLAQNFSESQTEELLEIVKAAKIDSPPRPQRPRPAAE